MRQKLDDQIQQPVTKYEETTMISADLAKRSKQMDFKPEAQKKSEQT
jgi:hypothetical protein